jgi:putative flippase GtrA
MLAGAINTLFGYAVYSLGIILGAQVWLALLAGMLLGSVFNFLTTGGYAFRQLSRQRYPRFVVCYLVVYGINLLLIDAMSLWTTDKLVSQAILLVPLAMLSYALMVRLVFAKDATTNPP